jgi:hypothetical protein
MTHKFTYSCGVVASVGDIIRIAGQCATVEKIIVPGTNDAIDYHCQDTGGLLIHFDNGDLQLWIDTNEDIDFLHRGNL